MPLTWQERIQLRNGGIGKPDHDIVKPLSENVDSGITEELLQSRPMIQCIIDGFSQRGCGDFQGLCGFALLKGIPGQKNGFLSGDPPLGIQVFLHRSGLAVKIRAAKQTTFSSSVRMGITARSEISELRY